MEISCSAPLVPSLFLLVLLVLAVSPLPALILPAEPSLAGGQARMEDEGRQGMSISAPGVPGRLSHVFSPFFSFKSRKENVTPTSGILIAV